MILSFRCTETEKVFRGQPSRKFQSIYRVALRKLMQLNAAVKLSDLAGTGAALEALKHDRARQYAIRINDRYRLCFVWTGSDAGDVEIVDYH